MTLHHMDIGSQNPYYTLLIADKNFITVVNTSGLHISPCISILASQNRHYRQDQNTNHGDTHTDSVFKMYQLRVSKTTFSQEIHNQSRPQTQKLYVQYQNTLGTSKEATLKLHRDVHLEVNAVLQTKPTLYNLEN